jgi:hypothetical protein
MAQLFAEEGLTYDYYMMPAGLAFQAPKFGGLSFTWKEKLTGNAILNPAFADLVFKGLNSTYIDSIVYDAFGIAIRVERFLHQFFRLLQWIYLPIFMATRIQL